MPSPSDGRHACSRRCQLALEPSEEQATFTRPLHSPGDCKVVWCWFVKVFDFVALIPVILRHFHPFVADRRATARTTETLSHAATSQKKRINCAGFLPSTLSMLNFLGVFPSLWGQNLHISSFPGTYRRPFLRKAWEFQGKGEFPRGWTLVLASLSLVESVSFTHSMY